MLIRRMVMYAAGRLEMVSMRHRVDPIMTRMSVMEGVGRMFRIMLVRGAARIPPMGSRIVRVWVM